MGAEKQQPHELIKAKQSEKHEEEAEIFSLPDSDYSDAKPSEVTDVYWIYAERKRGKYPKATPRSGKWLIFVDPENVDEVWAKIKKAVEEGKYRR